MIDVSIIIVNFKTPLLTIDCIKSIRKFSQDFFYEIIVVDNGSNDDSLDKLEVLSDEIVLIKSKSNVGFGNANNLGAEIAKGKYLFLLNSDTVIHNNACRIFLDYFSNDENARNTGALGCIMLDKFGNLNFQNSFGSFPTVFSYLKAKFRTFLNFSIIDRRSIQRLSDGELVVDYIVGADLFIRKEVFDSLGGFNPNFFMYWEEVDLQYRMKSKGFIARVIEGPVISHLEGSSTRAEGNIWKRNQESASLLLFASLNYSKYTYYLFKISMLVVFSFQFFRFKYSLKDEFKFLKNLNNILK